MMLIVPLQETIVYFFPTMTGFYCILYPIKAAKVICLPFECDLGNPFAAAFALINTGKAAPITGYAPALCGFQNCNKRTFAEFQVFQNHFRLKAAAAPGLSGLQQRLAHNRFPATVTAAFPAVHPISLAGIFNHSQPSESGT